MLTDATPPCRSLILAAVKKPNYAKLVDEACAYGKSKGGSIDEQIEHTMNRLVREPASTRSATQLIMFFAAR